MPPNVPPAPVVAVVVVVAPVVALVDGEPEVFEVGRELSSPAQAMYDVAVVASTSENHG
jgi:hypothetical protein